ncbi:MAG: PH domain-containing protein [Thermomicrobiales bacterium]|nr:PH domain-containing protein [Thermomicrobiales bacterium]
MSYIDDLLGKNETIELVAHRHVVFMVLRVLPLALLCIAAWVAAISVQMYVDQLSPWLALAIVVASLVPLAMAVYRFFVWHKEQYVVTNYRILQAEGILNKRTFDSALEKVNDVLMRQSVIGRVFDYGDIEIITGSEVGVNQLTGIADPFAFKRALLNAKLEFHDPGDAPRRSFVEDQSHLLAALTDLRNSGIISEDEFAERRTQILSSQPRS